MRLGNKALFLALSLAAGLSAGEVQVVNTEFGFKTMANVNPVNFIGGYGLQNQGVLITLDGSEECFGYSGNCYPECEAGCDGELFKFRRALYYTTPGGAHCEPMENPPSYTFATLKCPSVNIKVISVPQALVKGRKFKYLVGANQGSRVIPPENISTTITYYVPGMGTQTASAGGYKPQLAIAANALTLTVEIKSFAMGSCCLSKTAETTLTLYPGEILGSDYGDDPNNGASCSTGGMP